MNRCTVTEYLEIVPAGRAEYDQLARFHYRSRLDSPYAAVYALKETHPVRRRFMDVVGVIVYTMPAPSLELRNFATGGFFTGLGDRRMHLQLVNANIRCISRVIIAPRYRSLGLAQLLVRRTMPRLNVAVIEAMAVMGERNPFFKKAGMTAYRAKPADRNIRIIEALGIVGIDENLFIDPQALQRKLNKLSKAECAFIEREMMSFLQAYGKRKHMAGGIERTRFVLSKITARPVYYIWFNPKKKIPV